MVQQIIKTSPHGSFTVTQLSENIVICEDIHNKQKWGNQTLDQPAFMTYLGCSKHEVSRYVQTFNNLYGCKWCEVRNPKYLTDFECEIKVKGMSRVNLNSLINLVHAHLNLNTEILEAAELLKEEEDLLGSKEQIAKSIVHWLSEQLEDICWHYHNSSSLEKRIFQIEVERERALDN